MNFTHSSGQRRAHHPTYVPWALFVRWGRLYGLPHPFTTAIHETTTATVVVVVVVVMLPPTAEAGAATSHPWITISYRNVSCENDETEGFIVLLLSDHYGFPFALLLLWMGNGEKCM